MHLRYNSFDFMFDNSLFPGTTNSFNGRFLLATLLAQMIIGP